MISLSPQVRTTLSRTLILVYRARKHPVFNKRSGEDARNSPTGFRIALVPTSTDHIEITSGVQFNNDYSYSIRGLHKILDEHLAHQCYHLQDYLAVD